MLKEPVRIIEGTTKPFERFWNLRAAEDSESGEPEIEFYGPISEYSWWGDEVTPQLFKDDLEKHGKGGPVTIRIHSPGGDVFAASAIRAMIVDYPGKVTTRIDGLCASAATYVAMAGDRVVMQDSAFFMIHDPWTVTWGGVEELKQTINFLKTIKDGIVETYQNKTHMEVDEIARMMSNETWMTARQAQEKGFVDEVVSVNDAKAFKMNLQNVAILNCLRGYENVPEELLVQSENPEDQGAMHCAPTNATENVTDEDPISDGNETDAEDAEVPAPSQSDGAESSEERSKTEGAGDLVDLTEVVEEIDDRPIDQVKAEEVPAPSSAVEEYSRYENDSARQIRELRDYLDIFGVR